MAKTRSKKKVSSKKQGAQIKAKLALRTPQASTATNAVDRLFETSGQLINQLRCYRFAGVALGGGKTDKTAVAVLEYYPDQKRVFLRSLRDKISNKGEELSADENLYTILTYEEKDLTSISIDAPLQLPKCIRCEVKCPGLDRCTEPTVTWIQEMHKKRKKRPNKMFTPYTERAVEIYISNELEEPFHPSHALGANAAPLLARAHFLRRRLTTPVLEVFPKLSLWRIGSALGVMKSHLRFHKHAIDSDEARLFILKTLIEKQIAFVYQQDLRTMVDSGSAFDAFIAALTGFLTFRGQTEKPPQGFPSDEGWIEFPKEKIQWF